MLLPDGMGESVNSQADKKLTNREHQVLQAVWDGLSVKAIANRLKLSVRTVEYHKAMILRKWHCGSMLGACRLGLKRGYLKV